MGDKINVFLNKSFHLDYANMKLVLNCFNHMNLFTFLDPRAEQHLGGIP